MNSDPGLHVFYTSVFLNIRGYYGFPKFVWCDSVNPVTGQVWTEGDHHPHSYQHRPFSQSTRSFLRNTHTELFPLTKAESQQFFWPDWKPFRPWWRTHIALQDGLGITPPSVPRPSPDLGRLRHSVCEWRCCVLIHAVWSSVKTFLQWNFVWLTRLHSDQRMSSVVMVTKMKRDNQPYWTTASLWWC